MGKKIKTITSLITITIFVVTNFAYAQSFDTDLENFREELDQRSFSDFTRTYHEKVNIFNAWEATKESGANLSFVNIGIMDTGVDSVHQEFIKGVDFGTTIERDPLLLIDMGMGIGHGTSVAGIIGANNITEISGYEFPHMNGILSGASVDYALELGDITGIRPADKWEQIFGFLPFMSTKLSKVLKIVPPNSVVNMSFGANKCSAVNNIAGCIKDNDFDDFRAYYEEGIHKRNDSLFVMSAGNDAIDAKDHLPGGV